MYRDFLESWAMEIQSRSDRVRTLIGDRHWASDGYHKEFLIREFLARYLPPPIRVGSGFIRSHLPNADCSPEIDILVTDPSNHPPFFDEGGLQIVPVRSVRAAIEIKATFGGSELKQALKRIAHIQALIHMEQPSNGTWLGAMFYRTGRSTEADSVLDLIESCYTNINSHIASLVDHSASEIHGTMDSVPTCICLLGEFIVFFRRKEGAMKTTQVDLFESKSLSFAFAAVDLICTATRGTEPTSLELVTTELGIDRAATRTIELGGNA